MRNTDSFNNTQEPIEIRFYRIKSKESYQLLANPVNNHVHYHLKNTKHGSVSQCLSNLGGDTSVVLPMKAYDEWQKDVIKWLVSLYHIDPIYQITDIL